MWPQICWSDLKTEKERNLLIYKDKPINKTVQMKMSRWDTSIDMFLMDYKSTFKNNQIIRFPPVLTSYQKAVAQ